MVRFSERNGFKPARQVVQVESLDDETRMGLWNLLYVFHFSRFDSSNLLTSNDHLALTLWIEWHQPLENYERTRKRTFLNQLKEVFLSGGLAEVFDLLEATAEHFKENDTERLNRQLEKYLVGYRMVDAQLQPVTEASEVEAIDAALRALEPFSGARKHLSNALSLLANRENPQYANVVKESISAVEAITRHYTGEKTLGAALRKLEPKGVPAHGALTQGWSMLFGYTSDEHGIRHGSIEDSEVDEALATYFVVSSSAMVGYVIKKAGESAAE